MVSPIFITINALKVILISFVTGCNTFIARVGNSILLPQIAISRTQRASKVIFLDAKPIYKAYQSYAGRFREAGFEPYSESKYVQMLLQKDLSRTHKPVDLQAISKILLDKVYTIRLL